MADLDAHLTGLSFAAAGEHGAEIRHRAGASVDGAHCLPPEVAQFVQAMEAELPGLLVELKTSSTSVHYRGAPAHGPEVNARMTAFAADWPEYELIHGKMVVEMKPAHSQQGSGDPGAGGTGAVRGSSAGVCRR